MIYHALTTLLAIITMWTLCHACNEHIEIIASLSPAVGHLFVQEN